MADLLCDILEHILIRLDGRNVIRCKIVCKSWKSLISDSRFVKAHLEYSYNKDLNDHEIRDRRIIMARGCFLGELSQIDVGDRLFDHHACHLLGSSNGLVCISPSNAEILVANPLTREVKKMQKPNIPENRSLCWGFGYDSSTDDYKVVLGFTVGDDLSCVQVLTLKSNIWKAIGVVNYTFISRVGILCNGALHWVMKDASPQNKKKVILSFHLSKEEFNEIPQPDDTRYEHDITRYPNMHLGVVDKSLCVFRPEMVYPLWIMKKYNDKESWGMLGNDCDRKYRIAHCLKQLKHYIPHKRSLCHPWFVKTMQFIGAPIYVQSLVSPHVNGRPKRKRQAENRKANNKMNHPFWGVKATMMFEIDTSVPGPSAGV